MNDKTKKSKCVECRFCDTEVDAHGTTHRVCTHKRRALPANVTSRLACGKFKPPRNTGHWGA